MQKPVFRILIASIAATSAIVVGEARADESIGARIAPYDLAGLDGLSREAPKEFAGTFLDEASQRVIVQVVARRSAGAIRRLADRGASRRATLDDTLAIHYRVVERSQEMLAEIQDSITRDKTWATDVGGDLREWGVDVERNVVGVGVAKLTPELEAAAHASFGSAVELFEAEPSEQTTNRLQDTSPFFGGLFINDGVKECSNAFMIFNTANPCEIATSTAGHCFSAGSAIFNTGSHNYIGNIVWRIYENNGLDIAFIRNAAYSPFIYSGPSLGPGSDERIPVRGYGGAIVGHGVCNGGSASGEVCGFKVQKVDFCLKYDDSQLTHCRLTRAEKFGGIFIRVGDSGGPVFQTWTAAGKPHAVAIGSISGRTGPERMLYHETRFYVPQGWSIKLAP